MIATLRRRLDRAKIKAALVWEITKQDRREWCEPEKLHPYLMAVRRCITLEERIAYASQPHLFNTEGTDI